MRLFYEVQRRYETVAQPGLYPAWPLDLQLVGVRCHTEDKECRRMKRGRCCSAFNSDGEKLFDQRWPGFSKSF